MCLVVLYGVPKTVDTTLVEKMLYMNFDAKPLVNEFKVEGYNVENYNFYSIGVCNCGSYISQLSNTKFDNFKEYFENKKIEYFLRQKNVEKLRANPKYNKLVEKFKKEYDKNRREMQKYSVSDTKRMNEYQKFLDKNTVFVDDLLGGLTNDSAKNIINMNIEDVIKNEVLVNYEKDTNIIDGALTVADNMLIIPIWTDGRDSYIINYKVVEYKDLDENMLGKLKYNSGLKIY